MDSSDTQSLNALDDDEMSRLVSIVVEEFGPAPARIQFNDMMLSLSEHIAGLETIPTRTARQYLNEDISELYRIERLATDLGLSHARRGIFRHAKAKPVLKRLQRRFRALDGGLPLFGKLREIDPCGIGLEDI